MHAFVIGDNYMNTGFRLVGVEGVEVTSVDEAKVALNKALEIIDIAVIIIDEEFSSKMREEIANIRSTRTNPLIVEIPGPLGSKGEIRLSDLVSKTVGVKI